ncbi:hypothetical protein NE237_008970 [Protea cynaroides]|uniref:Uncharacterized protein n=1 Tax=Protea cynaroides TaxID=273540 RepID=A0A9Q0QZU5_9MAGN|nr:hypothetical protein NE237_008970 [Protea cynaroides]
MLDSVGKESPRIVKDLLLRMDASVPYGVADPKHISTHDLKHSDVNHKQCYQKKDVNHKQNTSAEGDDSVADLGDALTGILHLQDVHESLAGQCQPFGREEICHPEAELCKELIIDLAESVTGTVEKSLTKSATFPCFKKDSSVDEKMPSMGFSELRPPCTRSISLPGVRVTRSNIEVLLPAQTRIQNQWAAVIGCSLVVLISHLWSSWTLLLVKIRSVGAAS